MDSNRMKMNLAAIFHLIVLAYLGACSKQEERLPLPSNILEINPNYIDNGQSVSIRLSGYNIFELSKNRLFIDNREIRFDSVSNHISVDVPDDTFDEKHYSRTLKYTNGFDTASAVLLYHKFPRVLEVLPKRVYPGEEITIEGDNLAPKAGITEILFTLDNGETLQPSTITFADDYTIKAIVPNNATGTIFYKNILGEESLPRVLLLDSIFIKK